MEKTKIAVIGASFSGLCVTSNIIYLLKKEKKFASLTLFEPKENPGGRAYDIALPDNFKLNHEANYMGIVSPFKDNKVKYNDFFLWIQANKNKSLPGLSGQTLAQRYSSFDLDNEYSYLPRSLYGYYLLDRKKELITHSQSSSHTLSIIKEAVNNISVEGKKFCISWQKEKALFDFVILCTGLWYNKYDSTDSIYTSRNLQVKENDSIGIIGCSLSAIEIALSLAEKGYKDITMYSRHGRLPKVRGKTLPYQPHFISNNSLEKLHNKFGHIKLSSLLPMIKAEFDFAYKQKGRGLYQEKGINWDEILFNRNPIKQLEEDIRTSEKGEEIIWRSVLSSIYTFEHQLWRNLHRRTRERILSHYGSFLISFIASIPLPQAKRLYHFISNGVIKVIGSASAITEDDRTIGIMVKGNTKIVKDFIIDARGPTLNVLKNPFLSKLVQANILQQNPAGGIVVNGQLQVVSHKKIYHNMYALGPMVYGQRPHNSSIFTSDYAENVAAYIVNSIKDDQVLEYEDMQFEYDNFSSLAI